MSLSALAAPFATNDAGTFLVADMQHVGFAWSRWYPCTDWPRIQPDAADRWTWPDKQVDDLESHGFSLNAVIYNGMPKWAQGKHPYLPKDMDDWKADDPRWGDLTIDTSYDRFVKALVTHYKNRSIAWEVANEPLWQKWDPALYTRFVERTYKLVKSICPNGKVMTDGCYGIDDLHRGFLAHGGNQFHDVFHLPQLRCQRPVSPLVIRFVPCMTPSRAPVRMWKCGSTKGGRIGQVPRTLLRAVCSRIGDPCKS